MKGAKGLRVRMVVQEFWYWNEIWAYSSRSCHVSADIWKENESFWLGRLKNWKWRWWYICMQPNFTDSICVCWLRCGFNALEQSPPNLPSNNILYYGNLHYVYRNLHNMPSNNTRPLQCYLSTPGCEEESLFLLIGFFWGFFGGGWIQKTPNPKKILVHMDPRRT